MNPVILEYSALTIGTIGTLLWALGKNQLIVSILWMTSALLWIAFALLHQHYGLTLRDLIGVILYSVGIYTYWKNSKTKMLVSIKNN